MAYKGNREMHLDLKETLKDAVKYPWHTVFATSKNAEGITYCVKNSMGVKLLTVNKISHFDRQKKRVVSEYSMIIHSEPEITMSDDKEHVDIEGIFHSCETRISKHDEYRPGHNATLNHVIRFLKQNQK